MFTPEQIRKYAQHVFPDHRFTDRPDQRMPCPIHQGRDKNFAFNMARGVWTCHSRCGSGGLVQLENRLRGGSREDATERLFQLLGVAPEYQGKQIVCTYDYTDGSGRLLFQNVRLEPKDFRFRTPVGPNGYTYCSPPQKRPLYGLMGVLTANCLFITEGEKDADTLNCITDWPAGSIGRVYATTAGAAGSFTSEHAMLTAGKRVLILEDNDEKGRVSALAIAELCHSVAQSIRIVRFDEMPEKSDVSDFLKEYGIGPLLEKIKSTPFWHPPQEEEKPVIVEAISWATTGTHETNWLVDGVIQQEGNGVICGDPKASKSLLSLHLIAHLISGTPWFGHAIRERVKVGLVTREDAPGLTKSRIGRLIRGERLQNISSLDGWLWINSREQTKTFDILDDGEFNMLVRQFKKKDCRIVFFDVFNRIHTMNENDNQEMSRVTARLSLLGAEVGCQVVLIHHLNKDVNTGNIFNRLRGAGALHGWMEWGMAVTLTNPTDLQSDWVRRISFESKETAIDDLHYRIEGGPSDGYVSLIQVPDNPVAMHAPRGYRAPRNVERIALATDSEPSSLDRGRVARIAKENEDMTS